MITMDGRRLPHHTPASHMAPSAISLGPQRGRDDVDRMAHINPFPHNPQNQNSKMLVQKSNSLPMDSNKPHPDHFHAQHLYPRQRNTGWPQTGYPPSVVPNYMATNAHNTSQDSGLSPSPMEYTSQHQVLTHDTSYFGNNPHQRLSFNLPHMDNTGIYDNCRIQDGQIMSPNVQNQTHRETLNYCDDEISSDCSRSTPSSNQNIASNSPSTRWSFGGFFNKKKSRSQDKVHASKGRKISAPIMGNHNVPLTQKPSSADDLSRMHLPPPLPPKSINSSNLNPQIRQNNLHPSLAMRLSPQGYQYQMQQYHPSPQISGNGRSSTFSHESTSRPTSSGIVSNVSSPFELPLQPNSLQISSEEEEMRINFNSTNIQHRDHMISHFEDRNVTPTQYIASFTPSEYVTSSGSLCSSNSPQTTIQRPEETHQFAFNSQQQSKPKVAIAQIHSVRSSAANTYNDNLPEINEPFPPELDFSQISGKYNATVEHQPPPPPPRDPKKKLYLNSPQDSIGNGSVILNRPVSYSFENVNMTHHRNAQSMQNTYDDRLRLNPSIVAHDQNQLQSQIDSNDLSTGIPSISYNLSNSNYLSRLPVRSQSQNGAPPLPQKRRVTSASPSNRPSSHISSRSRLSEPREYPESTSLNRNKTKSSQNIGSLERQQRKSRNGQHQAQHPTKLMTRPRSNPSLSRKSTYNNLVTPEGAPPLDSIQNNYSENRFESAVNEYWKSPPHPFVASRDFRLDYEDEDVVTTKNNANDYHVDKENDTSHVNKLMQTATAKVAYVKDFRLYNHGKSSPGSTSDSSRDSGCSEPPPLAPIELPIRNRVGNRPLSAVYENESNNVTNEEGKYRIIECDDHENSVVDVINKVSDNDINEDSSSVISSTSSAPMSPVLSSSPPRSGNKDPGYSSKSRRILFRNAINEIEDTLINIGMDFDILDRAERRDLPTVHQEMIARSKEDGYYDSERSIADTLRSTDVNSSSDNCVFSDLDNFMNWNTSSSFENLADPDTIRSRSRTPANKRSGVYDKTTDDVIYRICKSNNKPIPDAAHPISKVNHSYLEKSEKIREASQEKKQSKKEVDFGEWIEPDTFQDDLAIRRVRDISQHTSFNPQDPQPLFGVPLLGQLAEDACKGRKDYLHQTADATKYRSTFHSMRNPDTVKDDLAFRALRKDSNTYNSPDTLGIYKDPNIPSHTSSCWKHHLDESVSRCSNGGRQSPTVFYPNRNNKIMQSLSQNALLQIKKQSVQANAGDPNSVIAYDDLLNDPDLMEAVKYNLGVCDQGQTNDVDETDGSCEKSFDHQTKTWKGKTLYELFHDNQIILRVVRQEPDEKESETHNDHPVATDDNDEQADPINEDGTVNSFANTNNNFIIQMCILDSIISDVVSSQVSRLGISDLKINEEDCTAKEKNQKLQNSISVVEEMESSSSSAMRALEREDSSSTEDKNTTAIYVPNVKDTDCDKNENIDDTICDVQLDSLENNVSLPLEADGRPENCKNDSEVTTFDSILDNTEGINEEPSLEYQQSFDKDPSLVGITQEDPKGQTNTDSPSNLRKEDGNENSSGGETEVGNTNNPEPTANEDLDARIPREHFRTLIGQVSHNPEHSYYGTNHHPAQTCTNALTQPPPPNNNTVAALKGHTKGDTWDNDNGNEQNFPFGENSIKSLFPKRKISSVGELMEEVHPLIFALCYLLACLANQTGVDFVTILGVLLTLISMMSMIFI